MVSGWFCVSGCLFRFRDRLWCAIGCSCLLVTWVTSIWLRWRWWFLVVSRTTSVKSCCSCISKSYSFHYLMKTHLHSFYYYNRLLSSLVALYTASDSTRHCSSISTISLRWFHLPDWVIKSCLPMILCIPEIDICLNLGSFRILLKLTSCLDYSFFICFFSFPPTLTPFAKNSAEIYTFWPDFITFKAHAKTEEMWNRHNFMQHQGIFRILSEAGHLLGFHFNLELFLPTHYPKSLMISWFSN